LLVEIESTQKVKEVPVTVTEKKIPAVKQQSINLIEPETKSEEGIGWVDYKNMLQFSSGNCGIILFFLSASLGACMQLAVSYWLARWTKQDLEEQQK